jgi:hypothetical protein
MPNARLQTPGVPQTLLLQVHHDALWQGFMLLGLAWAAVLSDLASGVEIVASLLLVAATALSIGSTVANWRMNVTDQFPPGSKPLRYTLAAINALLARSDWSSTSSESGRVCNQRTCHATAAAR